MSERERRGPTDLALWDAVKKTIAPLRKSLRPAADKPASGPRKPVKQQKPALRAPAAPAPAPVLPPLAALDRRARQRVARGSTEIEARIDLHGLKQSEAKERLSNFLHRAQARGQSLVLVITGKGTAAAEGAERGVLRRAVPLWLALPEFRALVIGFEEAAPAHGGGGALYVRIRRRRG